MIYIICILLILHTVSSELGSPCLTPNGEKGTCKPLSSCLHFQNKILNLDKSAFQFTINSVCSNDTIPLVCCGSMVSYSPEELNLLKPIIHKLLPKPALCGIQINENVVRENDVLVPWMAALRYTTLNKTDAGFRCRGSLINKRYILTTAQCLYLDGYMLIGVRLGVWKLSLHSQCTGSACSNLKDYGIEETIPHPDFIKNYGLHDIGLIRVTEDISYDEYIRPICLPPNKNDLPAPTDKLNTAGWVVGTRRDLQVKQPLLIESDPKCSTVDFNATVLIVCPPGKKYKYSCESAAGNPIMRKYPSDNEYLGDEQWYQEGIMYKDSSCKHKRFSGPYLRVSKYVLWILTNIK